VILRLSSRLRTRLLSSGADGGFAMIMVLGTTLVLSLLVVVATTSALGSVRVARADQDFQSALGAAEAGVDDYLSHLTLDATYYAKGNTDASNPALGATAFTALSGSTTGAGFHYRLLSSPADVTTSGQLVLESTGRSKSVTRTVRVTLQKKSFLDYLYFTTYETLDPLNTTDPTANAACGTFAWAGRAATCTPVVWTSADLLRGPVYSLDTMQMNGTPTFQKQVETGWDDPAKKYWQAYNGSAAPVFSGGAPTRSQQEMPSTNAGLRDQAVLGNGCLYSGPTKIVFNSTGTMTVTSPFTTSSTYDCGTFSAPSYTSTVNVPDNGVVYVDPVTADCTTTASTSRFAAVGYPIANDTTMSGVAAPLGYACTNGDAFVEGDVQGRVTLGTANNVVITRDLKYVGGTTGTNVLGISAGNFVELYRPMTCGIRDSTSKQCLAGTDVTVSGRYPWTNPVVQAAVVATSHSFFVQNWKLSGTGTGSTAARNLGTLTLTGAIAQRFRGPVSHSNTNSGDSNNHCFGVCGYGKDYYYDARLKYAPPPYLADLTASAWGVRSFGEGPS